MDISYLEAADKKLQEAEKLLEQASLQEKTSEQSFKQCKDLINKHATLKSSLVIKKQAIVSSLVDLVVESDLLPFKTMPGGHPVLFTKEKTIFVSRGDAGTHYEHDVFVAWLDQRDLFWQWSGLCLTGIETLLTEESSRLAKDASSLVSLISRINALQH